MHNYIICSIKLLKGKTCSEKFYDATLLGKVEHFSPIKCGEKVLLHLVDRPMSPLCIIPFALYKVGRKVRTSKLLICKNTSAVS